jgi:hypothetical protein
MGCVAYGIPLGLGRGFRLVCSTSSRFSSGCCSQWVFWPQVSIVSVCACDVAHLVIHRR